MNDIYEPLGLYRDSLGELHRQNTAECFQELVDRSGVDVKANAGTNGEIRKVDKEIATADGRRGRWSAVRVLCYLVAAAAVAAVVVNFAVADVPFLEPLHVALCVAGAIGLVLFGTLVAGKKIKALQQILDKLAARRKELVATAWEQMAPLNRLFDWGIPAKIIQKTAPRIALDPFFTEGRLKDLYGTYHWDDSVNRNRSVLCSQSGEINGNPFVLCNTLTYEFIDKEYTGHLTIHWTERETYTDAKGNLRSRTVTRTQVLTATLVKPFPDFREDAFLLYGNPAAPDLTFSRRPQKLSGADNTWTNRLRRKREIKKLEKFSRNLDDDSQYTMMANREFELLFHATDRSDEIEFRLLFTPLAQQQMVRLLNDTKVGFGDDFRFHKIRMCNLVFAEHLNHMSLDTNPAQFESYDLEASRKAFLQFNHDYFRGLFFALAPLLSIPLYQQMRSHEDIYRSVYDRAPSFWEHEALANFHGEQHFRAPNCATKSILKTELQSGDDGMQRVAVTAHGFRAIRHVDYVPTFGGDGKWHDVPVEWLEYVPVSRTSQLDVMDTNEMPLPEYREKAETDPELNARFTRWNPQHVAASYRRTLLSFITLGTNGQS